MNSDRMLRSHSKTTSKKAISVSEKKSSTVKPRLSTAPKAKNPVAKPVARTSYNVNNSSVSAATTTTSRFSTSSAAVSSRLSTASIQSCSVKDTVSRLESRVSDLESIVARLTSENTDLREAVSTLQADIALCKNRLDEDQRSAQAAERKVSLKQEELNSNIVIRGVDVGSNPTNSDLLAVFEGIRSHLNVSGIDELTPVSVTQFPSNKTSTSAQTRPIRVEFCSVAAKRKFLQVRRTKKDILQSDIGINNTSRRPILISEQLTRSNQELLYQARSLRAQNHFKFVWSTDGQILARLKEKTKVIRIIDTEHVNQLRSEFGLEPLSQHGRLHATTTVEPNSSIS